MNIRQHTSALFTLVMLATVASADSITLRGSVRMPADGGPLLLKHAAVLKGAEALQYQDLEIPVPGARHEAVEMHVDVIQELLADAGVNWAKVALSGGAVVVRPRANAHLSIGLNTSVAVAPAAAPVDGAIEAGVGLGAGSGGFRHIDDWADEGPLTRRIVELLREEWGRDASTLHIAIDTASLGELPVDSARIECSQRGSSRGADWFDVQFRALRGESEFRPTKTVLVRVDLRVKCESTIARRRLSANRTLKLDDLGRAPRLLKPSEAARKLAPEHLVGRRLQRRVDEGGLVLWSFLEPEVVVRRNDSVNVVMHGPFRLAGSEAMALERGAVGERINCRWRAGDEPFTALVIGPGEVRVGG